MTSERDYPTDDELVKIRNWPKDWPALMAYVKKIWWMADWGWHAEEEKDKTIYKISTGGWSGNEEIIDALKHNWFFWSACWESMRKGGHYVFEVEAPEK